MKREKSSPSLEEETPFYSDFYSKTPDHFISTVAVNKIVFTILECHITRSVAGVEAFLSNHPVIREMKKNHLNIINKYIMYTYHKI